MPKQATEDKSGAVAQVAEVQEKVEEAQVHVAEAQQDATITPEQAKELQGKLADLEAQLESARNESKAHQKAVFKKDEELRKSQTSSQDTAELKAQVGVLTQMVADIMDSKDSEGYEEEKPKTRRSDRYLQALEEKNKNTTQAAQEERQRRLASVYAEAESLYKSIGVDPMKLKDEVKTKPELMDSYLEFVAGNAEQGLEELRKVAPKLTEKKVEVKVETPEEMEARIRKKILIERGELDSETGQPKGAGEYTFTREEIGAMPMSEYEKKKPLIDKARLEGKIK